MSNYKPSFEEGHSMKQDLFLLYSYLDDNFLDVSLNYKLELGLTVFILFYLNEQIAELQGDGV